MSALIAERDRLIRLQRACAALEVSRATLYRHIRPKAPKPAANRRSCNARGLTEAERQAVLDVLHEPRFADQPPAQVYAKLLDEGRYLCSVRTMHRLLGEAGESGERRMQRAKTHHAVPRLMADAPNMVWSWDITKLATWAKGVFLSLYVVLDLYSRYVVAWMLAGRENSALAKQLLAHAITRHGIEPGRLRVHQDRGAPMTAHGFLDLLAELGVNSSHSRPRVSNDNAFSEAQFKTLKYQPDFPGRFRDGSMHAPGVPNSSTGTTIITSTRAWRCSHRPMCSTVASMSSSSRVKRVWTPLTPRIPNASSTGGRRFHDRRQSWPSIPSSRTFL